MAKRGPWTGAPIEVNRLTKRFADVVAVDDLSFVVRAGTVTGFLGPNGAGKSTTLQMLLGLVSPTDGEATILGNPYGSLLDPVRTVGTLLDPHQFHPKRSGRDALRVNAVAAGIRSRRVGEVLGLVELDDGKADRHVGGYSTGMRQRLGLANALLGEPQILVLDEPANGLDPEGMRWLRDFLRSFAREGGTVLVSSHVLGEVAQMADEVVIIAHGRLVEQGSVQELTGSTGLIVTRADRTNDLLHALEVNGIHAVLGDGGRITTHETTSRAVGRVASAAGIALTELRDGGPSLEELFLELTTDDDRLRAPLGDALGKVTVNA